MNNQVDFTKLKTSWTKFDIVQVMNVISSVEKIDAYKNKEIVIDEPILRSFLGIKTLKSQTPQYWLEIQKHPDEKKIFSFLAVVFTHGEVVKLFADRFSTGEMKGVFEIEEGKMFTNIRSALVESGVARSSHRRLDEVPYDLSLIYKNLEVGKLFKQVLLERITRLSNLPLTDEYFYSVCFSNNFHKAISLTKEQFKNWLDGSKQIVKQIENNEQIEEVEIGNFFAVKEALLDFNGSKEIYFLGENGDGKSLILMAIYLAFNGSFIIEKTDLEQTGRAIDIINNNPDINLLGIDVAGNEYDLKSKGYFKNMFAYGTHRGRYSTDEPEQYGFMSLFDTEQRLTNPVTWLKNQKLLDLEKRLDFHNILSEEKELPFSFPINVIERMFFELLDKNVEIKLEGEGVYFNEKGESLTFDQLSEGYKSILIFVTDLLYRLSRNSKSKETTADYKGVVLVDEIDLHLHPKWQRVIVKKLRSIFPNIQFILTTHSPTIIQGASEDAVIFRVYRNSKDGKTKVSEPYFRKDLNHLMVNTLITSPLFGLDDSRLDPNDNFADTSDSYLLYKINQKLEAILASQKQEGKIFVSDEDIDGLIQQIIKEELREKNDKGK